MTRPISKLSEINPKKETWKIVVCIIHLWIVHRKDKKVSSQDMTLVDSEGTKVEGSVEALLIPKFDPMLEGGRTYLMMNFMLQSNTNPYRVSSHRYKLKFLKTTAVRCVEQQDMPLYSFYFKKFEDMLSGDVSEDMLICQIGIGVHNSIFSTKLSINDDIPKIKDFLVRQSQMSLSSQSSQHRKFVRGVEMKSVVDLDGISDMNEVPEKVDDLEKLKPIALKLRRQFGGTMLIVI
ncbi:hypothetical protein L6164_028418 [Bauhinia variegata]|uniref:Uncharacterized protein n=1 Tax=Bauhinia variegata TaxID=167791 RepID=A0ACB9L5U9_BAUVA|nr:hypothetical protein L6164_028418 [Bauhinia variegata]